MAERSDNYTLILDGIKVPGKMTTDQDTGKVTWRPYVNEETIDLTGGGSTVRAPSTSSSITSEWDANKKTWVYKTNGNVFEDIRTKSDNSNLFEAAFTDSEGPGSGAKKLAGKFYLNDYKSLDQTINNVWSVYDLKQTAERGKPNVNGGASWIRGAKPADDNGGDNDNPDAKKTLETFEIEDISYEKDKDENPINVRRSYGNYYYPLSLGTENKQDVIKFTLKEIKGSTVNPNPGQKTFTRNYNEISGSVTLPIQPSITDSNIVEWSGFGISPLGSFAASAALKAGAVSDIGTFFSEIGGATNKALKELLESQSASSYQQAIKLAIAEQASGTQGLLSRATGAVINENFELLFAGPQLRPFTFSFRMSPRSKDEATQVRSIIRFFKQAMSVKTSSSNVFLKSPFVFDIKYLANGLRDHPSINRIKTCALLGCDIDYTPDQTYMTFNDDSKPGVKDGKYTMTSYGMTLRFSEIEPVFDKDYTNIAEDEIGY